MSSENPHSDFLNTMREKVSDDIGQNFGHSEMPSKPALKTPSGETNIINYYVADGFAEDCEMLLRRYLKHKVISFELFRDIFKKMRFTEIYTPTVLTKGESAELSEEVLFIAKQHMVKAKTFEHSVAGLFLLYGLARTQPFQRFASVRLTPYDIPAVTKILEIAREKGNYDVLYVLGSLLIEGPIEFHVGSRSFALERQYRKYFEDKVSTYSASNQRGVIRKDGEEKEALRSLSLAMRKYVEAKSKIPEEMMKKHTYVKEEFPDQLQKELEVLTTFRKVTSSTLSDQHQYKENIRKRALKNLAKNVRYPETSKTLELMREQNSGQSFALKNTEPNLRKLSKRKCFGIKTGQIASNREKEEAMAKESNEIDNNCEDGKNANDEKPARIQIDKKIKDEPGKKKVKTVEYPEVPLDTNINLPKEHKERKVKKTTPKKKTKNARKKKAAAKKKPPTKVLKESPKPSTSRAQPAPSLPMINDLAPFISRRKR